MVWVVPGPPRGLFPVLWIWNAIGRIGIGILFWSVTWRTGHCRTLTAQLKGKGTRSLTDLWDSQTGYRLLAAELETNFATETAKTWRRLF